MATVLSTARLRLREFGPDDAPFILELLNEPAFHRYIGDRGVRSDADAREYLRTGPIHDYAAHGFGLWCVERREDGAPAGMCGLLRRDTLPDVDIGFAFLARFCRRGYGREAASAVLDHARDRLGLRRVVAVTAQDNAASMGLLEKLGMRPEGEVEFAGQVSRLFAIGWAR